MQNPVFVLGAAITDLMGFPIGAPAPADSIPGRIRKAPGGVGRNLAENLVRLGLPIELITAFGDDENAEHLIRHCQEQAIGLRHSIMVEGQAGAIHLAILDEARDLFAGIADLHVLDAISPSFLEKQEALLEAAAIVLETNLPAPAIDWLVQQEWSIPLYLDPVSVPLSSRIADHIGAFHTIKANRRQAEALAGRSLLRPKDLEEVAQEWLAKGAQRVFITLGGHGAFAASREQSIHLPAIRTTVENTTGAGDAFMAGLIWASMRNWALDDCCRAGIAAASIAVRSPLANSPDLQEATVLELIKKLC